MANSLISFDGTRFLMGLKDDGFAIEVRGSPGRVKQLAITSYEFQEGVLFSFTQVDGNLLIKVERRNSSDYDFIGYLREEDGFLTARDDQCSNIKLIETEDRHYIITSQDKYYEAYIPGGYFVSNQETSYRSQFYFINSGDVIF